MKHRQTLLILFTLFLFFPLNVIAQIKGLVRDSLTKEPLTYISVFYEGKGVGTVTDNEGKFRVSKRQDTNELTFSSIGYQTKKVKVTNPNKFLTVDLATDDVLLSEIVIKPKKEKYSRKNNPAVEFMKKVIAHKKGLKLKNNDYYSFQKYQKMRTSLNDITDEQLEKGIYKKLAFLKDQMEESASTGKRILPVSIQESVTREIYRKSPESQKSFIEAEHSSGVDDFFATGDMLGTVLSDVFTDINIYDSDIRLLQRRFVSPIGSTATSFYQFYLMDTIQVAKDQEMIHLSFVPANPQDFGFAGHIYVMNDSTYAVKKCTMNLPRHTGVNWVTNLDIIQEYTQLPDGNWVLTHDDMTVELELMKGVRGVEVQRTTRYNNYAFEAISDKEFKHKQDIIRQPKAQNRSAAYWAETRDVPLTETEGQMDQFMDQLTRVPGFKYFILAAKAVIENYIETGSKGKPSKVDLGPINTMITSNHVDGLRLRMSATTTADLDPHWFFKGYGAYGFKDKKWKYEGEVTYSIRPREFFPWEYPQHYISLGYRYDVMSPMDKFLDTDKDNVFVSLKTSPVDQMSYMRDINLNYKYENYKGLGIELMARHRNDEPTAQLAYYKNDENKTLVHDITTAELKGTLTYSPGQTYINTKQRRRPVNMDAPKFTLSHTTGFKGLGGEYNFNLTEASLWKRFWLSSWGKLDMTLKAGAQWNTVPFPLLILPAANLSYITQNNETFNLINNMEFLNDRYASFSFSYDMNGKLLNRIPLIKRLKWREVFRVKGLFGTLTDKNNPYLSDNPELFLFPTRNGETTSFVMDKKTPYLEASVGIYNIFKLLHVEYVHRLTYRDHPNINKNGVRFMIQLVF